VRRVDHDRGAVLALLCVDTLAKLTMSHRHSALDDADACPRSRFDGGAKALLTLALVPREERSQLA